MAPPHYGELARLLTQQGHQVRVPRPAQGPGCRRRDRLTGRAGGRTQPGRCGRPARRGCRCGEQRLGPDAWPPRSTSRWWASTAHRRRTTRRRCRTRPSPLPRAGMLALLQACLPAGPYALPQRHPAAAGAVGPVCCLAFPLTAAEPCTLTRWHGRAENGARWLVVACAFVVSVARRVDQSEHRPVSGCMAVFRPLRRTLARDASSSPGLDLLLLLGWMALAITWSPAGLRPAVEGWWKYRGAVAVALDAFRHRLGTTRRRGSGNSRCCTPFWPVLPFAWPFPICAGLACCRRCRRRANMPGFGGHVGFSVMLAFVAWLCLLAARIASGFTQAGLGAFGLACVLNLFLINTGRTGQAGFLALVPLALHRWIGWRGIRLRCWRFHCWRPRSISRRRSCISESINPSPMSSASGPGTPRATTVSGMDFWVHSLGFIRESPLFGTGTGGYIVKYRQAAEQEGLPASRVNDNPTTNTC